MTTVRHIFSRGLIWLTALSALLPSLPHACACTKGDASAMRSTSGETCCRARANDGVKCRCRCCCRGSRVNAQERREVRHSCCRKQHAAAEPCCSCGLNCQCAKTEQPPATTPPFESEAPTQKVIDNALSFANSAVASQSGPLQHHRAAFDTTRGAKALDLCAILNRFTL